MDAQPFIILAYGFAGGAMALLCFATWLSARRALRQLNARTDA